MAGSMSDYLENKILDHILGGGDYARPATVYFAMFTVTPTDAGGGTEVSTGVWTNYARPAITNNATNFPAASSGLKSNGTVISFGTASITGTAPVIVAIGIYDAASAGNLLAWTSFTGQIVGNGAPVSIQIGDFTFTLD